MALEDKRDRKHKEERIPPNIFLLTDAKKIKLDHSIKPEKVVEMGYYPRIENIPYDPTFCDPLEINFNSYSSFACYFPWPWYPFISFSIILTMKIIHCFCCCCFILLSTFLWLSIAIIGIIICITLPLHLILVAAIHLFHYSALATMILILIFTIVCRKDDKEK